MGQLTAVVFRGGGWGRVVTGFTGLVGGPWDAARGGRVPVIPRERGEHAALTASWEGSLRTAGLKSGHRILRRSPKTGPH